jgi:hypothetical protein
MILAAHIIVSWSHRACIDRLSGAEFLPANGKCGRSTAHLDPITTKSMLQMTRKASDAFAN